MREIIWKRPIVSHFACKFFNMGEDLIQLAEELMRIDACMDKAEKDHAHLVEKVHKRNRSSALNLLHYLSLRSMDIRDLQDRLHAAGLSSMASAESHIRGQLNAILERLGKGPSSGNYLRYNEGKKLLLDNAKNLFGTHPSIAVPHIMVTYDSHLADNYPEIKNLVQSGMSIARINCAHDDQATWFRMIQHTKKASRVTGQECRIYMDLAGPKIRTVLKDGKKLRVEVGENIVLVEENDLTDEANMLGCTVPDIARQLNIGEIILFDDGLIEARVERIEDKKAWLRVSRVSTKKPFIKAEKGINFPESNLLLPALTKNDIDNLPFIEKHADMIGYSFVRRNRDIEMLQEKMNKNKKLSLIIKIETPEAVKNLPDLLFAGLKEERMGLMIARGDLAVEIGFERMSEIQEEILWISEAAHVPVIWATQVLENLNRSGIATRSEITDAAHAAMADCVMINKGEHIILTLETLRDILVRSGGHHVKKRFTFRPLAIASRFMGV